MKKILVFSVLVAALVLAPVASADWWDPFHWFHDHTVQQNVDPESCVDVTSSVSQSWCNAICLSHCLEDGGYSQDCLFAGRPVPGTSCCSDDYVCGFKDTALNYTPVEPSHKMECLANG